MTLARVVGGSVSDLTSLNQRLIALQVEGETSAEEEAAEGTGIVGVGGEQPGDPDDDTTEETEEVRGRFSNEDPFGYNRVKEWIEQTIFDGQTEGRTPLIGAFVNEWAEDLTPGDDPFPDDLADRIIQDQGFQAGAAWLPVREQLDSLPPVFQTQLEDEAGQVSDFVVTNNPLTGPEFRERVEYEESIYQTHVPNYRPVRQPGVTGPMGFTAEEREQQEQDGPALEGGVDRPFGFTSEEREAGEPETVRAWVEKARSSMPFVDGEQLIEALKPKASTSGGRGGGSRTIREIKFDRAHLLDQTAERWNEWMLSPDEAPMGQIGAWVDSYIREAKAFWSKKGVQLDFETFITNKMKTHPRYQTIYEHKTPGESELQFLENFRGPIRSLGLDAEFTRSQTERAVTSGVGPASQFERVSRERRVQTENQGDLSQRLASTIAGLGIS